MATVCQIGSTSNATSACDRISKVSDTMVSKPEQVVITLPKNAKDYSLEIFNVASLQWVDLPFSVSSRPSFENIMVIFDKLRDALPALESTSTTTPVQLDDPREPHWTRSRRDRDEEGNVLFLGPNGAVLNPGTTVKPHHHYSNKKHLTEEEQAERAAYRHWGDVQRQAWPHVDGRQHVTERIREFRANEKATNSDLHRDKLRDQSRRWTSDGHGAYLRFSGK